jgi:uncharacterized lipoprotein NlpE involved in copper resistance
MARHLSLFACVAVLTLSACTAPGPQSAEAMAAHPHSSRDALDWAGTYEGTLPCADCPGVRTRVQLRMDGTFTLTQEYLQRSVAPRTAQGRFEWDADGRDVLLEGPGGPLRFWVGEGWLQQRDRTGQPVGGANAAIYALRKQP